MKHTITDIFFDLDHTLWDFEKNSELTFRKIFHENHIAIQIDDFLSVYREVNLYYWKRYREEKITKEKLRYERLKKTFDELSYAVDDTMIHTLAEAYIKYLSTYTHLFKDTIAILNYLKPQYKLHIITNGFEEIQYKKMKNSNIHHYFTHVVNSESVGVKKPNPLIFEYALKKASVQPHKTIMIGDSLEADILGARNVGMKTIHYNTHNDAWHDHGIIITNLLEIKQYL